MKRPLATSLTRRSTGDKSERLKSGKSVVYCCQFEYRGVSLYRWVYDGARSIDKVQYLPDNARESIPSVARTVEHAAWHHGIGKRTPTEVVEDVIKDLAALSIQLGTFESNSEDATF